MNLTFVSFNIPEDAITEEEREFDFGWHSKCIQSFSVVSDLTNTTRSIPIELALDRHRHRERERERERERGAGLTNGDRRCV